MGEYLHLDCVYDAEKIGSQIVTLKLHSKAQSEIRVRDLYSLLETILKFKGLAMTRQEGNLVTIVPVAEALDVDPELVDPNTPSLRAGNMVVTRVFRLQFVNASSVTSLLQTMKLGVAVSAVQENQTLFVTCYAQRMGRIAQLIEMVDQPGEPKEFRFRRLQYTGAATVAQKILGLAQELRRIPITMAHSPKEAPEAASRSAPRPKGPSGSGPAPAEGEPGVYLDVDERTNRVLMVGSRDQLATVEELIGALDIPEQDVRTLSVYSIKHMNAADVMTKLGDLGIVNKPTPACAGLGQGQPTGQTWPTGRDRPRPGDPDRGDPGRAPGDHQCPVGERHTRAARAHPDGDRFHGPVPAGPSSSEGLQHQARGRRGRCPQAPAVAGGGSGGRPRPSDANGSRRPGDSGGDDQYAALATAAESCPGGGPGDDQFPFGQRHGPTARADPGDHRTGRYRGHERDRSL